jgi:SAM-dependent methyltransferase
MTNNPMGLVASGYDEISDAYFERFGVSAVRKKWVDRLVQNLPASGGRVLDIGCGSGIPVARDLVALGHSVVGVDGSAVQIAKARKNVPAATFLQEDMCKVEFETRSFDGVGAFYSITHVAPAEQGPLIARMASWLKVGGALVASFGTGASGEWTGTWLGTTMFFGHNREEATLQSLLDGGLKVRCSKIERQDNEDAAFLWIEAIKGC